MRKILNYAMGDDYSTFTLGHGMDRYDKLKFYLDRCAENLAYVLTISTENYSPQKLKRGIRGVSGLKAVLRINGALNLVVEGPEEDIISAADEIFVRTREPIGIVKYEGGDNMISFGVRLKEALDIARSSPVGRIHLYNPKEDSLPAIIQKSLAEQQDQAHQ